MFSDTLFRIVNIAGGLGLDDRLWRRQVLGPSPAEGRRSARRRIAEAAGAWCGARRWTRAADVDAATGIVKAALVEEG